MRGEDKNYEVLSDKNEGVFGRDRGWVQCAAAAARWQRRAGRRRACPIGRGAMLWRPVIAAGPLLYGFVPLSLPALCTLIPWIKHKHPAEPTAQGRAERRCLAWAAGRAGSQGTPACCHLLRMDSLKSQFIKFLTWASTDDAEGRYQVETTTVVCCWH